MCVAGWEGAALPTAPAYLASGLFGVRVPPNALARPGSCPQCAPTEWSFVRPTVSCLVGGYAHTEVPGQALDDQANLQSGASPAPYPFETEVLVSIGGRSFSFQESVQGGRSRLSLLASRSSALDVAYCIVYSTT